MTVGGLCDVPFHSVRACVLVRSFIDRSRPFGTLRGDAAECSGGVYDERWWLNELPRALSLPGNQIRSSSFLDQTPIDDIDPFCEVTAAKIISLSTRACARTHTHTHLSIHLSIYIHTHTYTCISVEITSNVCLVFLIVSGFTDSNASTFQVVLSKGIANSDFIEEVSIEMRIPEKWFRR